MHLWAKTKVVHQGKLKEGGVSIFSDARCISVVVISNSVDGLEKMLDFYWFDSILLPCSGLRLLPRLEPLSRP